MDFCCAGKFEEDHWQQWSKKALDGFEGIARSVLRTSLSEDEHRDIEAMRLLTLGGWRGQGLGASHSEQRPVDERWWGFQVRHEKDRLKEWIRFKIFQGSGLWRRCYQCQLRLAEI